jgi:5-methylthioadenosine/S-adenosylhomocysteine deaminase
MTDLVVRAGLVVTMDDERRVVADGAVAVTGDRITAVGRAADVLAAAGPGVPVHHVADGWVTPGLVDAHQHLTGDRLVRSSIPDDLAAGEAIFSWAVPVHAHHSPDDDELSATLAAVEAAGNGVTTIVEAGTVAHPERVAAGLAAVGVRGTVGTWGWDADGVPFAAPADEVLDRQRAVLDRFPPGGLVSGWVTLVGHDLMSDELLVGASRRRGWLGPAGARSCTSTSSAPSAPTCCSPTPCTCTTRRSTSCCGRGRPSRRARGRTCASPRG